MDGQALCSSGEALLSVSLSTDPHMLIWSTSDRRHRIISLANLANVLTFYVSSIDPQMFTLDLRMTKFTARSGTPAQRK